MASMTSPTSRLRDVARGGVELLATASGLTALGRWIRRDWVTILAYHNVVADADAGRGDASLHLPLPEFVRQIDGLARTHEIVGLDSLATHGGRRPRAVITFDDAYRGAVTLALPELVRRGLPAVVFVSPALLGAASTWWDEMGEAGILSPEARRQALEELGGSAEEVRARAFGGDPVPSLPESYGIATAEELEHHCGGEGPVSVGSHSWAHRHLPGMDAGELRDDLERTLGWMRGFQGPTSPWLALPYGAGTPETSRVALEGGHAGVLRIEGGQWDPTRDRSRVPRINVPAGLSRRGLELRASGLRR